MLFLVGRTTDGQWQFQGLFDSQQSAEDACRDDSYFVGVCELNELLPHEKVPWKDAWYPKLETREEGVARLKEMSA